MKMTILKKSVLAIVVFFGLPNCRLLAELSAEPIALTESNFETEALKSPVPILVEFWAPWSAPNRTLSPRLNELLQAHSGKLRLGRVNFDDYSSLPQKYGVSSIPVLLFLEVLHLHLNSFGIRETLVIVRINPRDMR